MEFEITEQPQIILLGVSYYGTLQGEGWANTNSIGKLWGRFSGFFDKYKSIYEKTVIDKTKDFEMHLWQKEHFDETGEFQVFVGYLTNLEKLPMADVYLDFKVIPSSNYLIMKLSGNEIGQWEQILEKEISKEKYPRRKFGLGSEFVLQVYDENYKPSQPDESILQIWVPITG